VASRTGSPEQDQLCWHWHRAVPVACSGAGVRIRVRRRPRAAPAPRSSPTRVDRAERAMNSTSTSSSTTSAFGVEADSRASDCSVAAAPRASRMSAAPGRHARRVNSAPNHGLSCPDGRFVTRGGPPCSGNEDTNSPATPPTSFASPPRTTPLLRGARDCVAAPLLHAPRAASNCEQPNKRRPQAPKEIGDQPLNMMAGKFADWKIMCQNAAVVPRSIVRSAPERIAPTAATFVPGADNWSVLPRCPPNSPG